MADVFLVAAESVLGFEKILVLKRLKRALAEDPDFVAMFVDESRLAARLEHPHIVRTSDLGDDEGTPFLVMEYLEGQSLHRLMHAASRANSEIPLNVALLIARGVLSALEYAHRHEDFRGRPVKLVHRDVSPGNILLGYSGEVKLADFGVAKAALRTAETNVGVIKGKAMFMAPEQLAGGAVDARADIYSVGAVLWTLCAGGRPPWKTPMKRRGPPPRLRSIGFEIPSELDALIARALADSPNDRYQSALEMLDDLDTLVQSRALRATRQDLGNLLAERFTAERTQTTRLVRERLAQLRDQVVATLPRVKESVPPEPTSISLRPDAGPLPVERPSRARYVLGSAVAAVAGLCALLVWSQRGDDDARASSAPTGPPSLGVATAPRAVTITIMATPANATIEVNGRHVAGNPVTMSMVPDRGQPHVVRISAPGHETATRHLLVEREAQLQVELRPQPSAPEDDGSRGPQHVPQGP